MQVYDNYCLKCCNCKSDPSVSFDENGVCEICNKGKVEEAVTYYKDIVKNTEEYEESLKNVISESEYHCLIMLSGGKDSIYKLYELLENKKKPLAFTFNHPFESHNAKRNIEKIKKKLHFDYYDYYMDSELYNKAMRAAFTLPAKQTTIEHSLKRPCYMCGNIIIVAGFCFAYRFNIPYFLYCADPIQMLSLPKSIKAAVDLIAEYTGRAFIEKILPKTLINRIENNKLDGLPKMIFPYSNKKYIPMQIINKLKQADLYETSPKETHCQLLSLLSYYSIKRYNTFFYSHEFAAMVRNKIIPRQNAIDYLEEYKDIILNIAPKDNISDVEIQRIHNCLKFQYRHDSVKDQLEYEKNNIISLGRIAEIMGLDLSEV